MRAPLTGIVLAVEMTGRADLTLGLLGASLTAMVVAMLLKSEPIYESLKRRMLSQTTVSPRRVDAGVTKTVRRSMQRLPWDRSRFLSLIDFVILSASGALNSPAFAGRRTQSKDRYAAKESSRR